MAVKLVALVILALSPFILNSVSGLDCYECSATKKNDSKDDLPCFDKLDDSHLTNCENRTANDVNEYECALVELQAKSGDSEIHRKCQVKGVNTCDTYKDMAKTMDKELVQCKVCNADKCNSNSAHSLNVSMLFSILPTLFIFCLMK